jgi:hypothetical protein
MKKLLFIILCLIPTLAFPQADHIGGAAMADMGEYGAASVEDIGELGAAVIDAYCLNLPADASGSETFLWTGEHTTDDGTAWSDAGDLTGSKQNGAVVDSSGAICGSEGLNTVYQDYIRWAANEGTAVETDISTFCIDFDGDGNIGSSNTGVAYVFTDVNNYVGFYINTSRQVVYRYRTASTNHATITSTALIPTTGKTTVCFSWDKDTGTYGEIALKVGDEAEETQAAAQAWTLSPTYIAVGDALYTGGDDCKIDNARIYGTYKAWP